MRREDPHFGMGLNLSATGLLSGTPTLNGAATFNVSVVDDVENSASGSFTIHVNATPTASTSALADWTVGRPFDQTIAHQGGTPPLTWSVASGSLPFGVSLDPSTGAISGTIISASPTSATFALTDSCGAVATTAVAPPVALRFDLSHDKASAGVSFGASGSRTIRRYVELTAGTSLSATLAGGANGTDLPTISLADATGVPIDLSQWTSTKGKNTQVKGFVVPATGRYYLAATVAPGFQGKATFAISITPPKSFASHATLSAAPTEFRFSAPPGALVSIVAKAAKGSAALPRVVSVIGPDGATDLVPGGKTVEKGGTASFSSKAPLAGGDWRVVFEAHDGSSGDVAWTVS